MGKKKGKGNTITIRMQSTESKWCYFTKKNRKTNPEKLERMKYDPTLMKHVQFKETR